MLLWCEHCYMQPKPRRIPMKLLGRSMDYVSGHPAALIFGCDQCMKAEIVVITPTPEAQAKAKEYRTESMMSQ